MSNTNWKVELNFNTQKHFFIKFVKQNSISIQCLIYSIHLSHSIPPPSFLSHHALSLPFLALYPSHLSFAVSCSLCLFLSSWSHSILPSSYSSYWLNCSGKHLPIDKGTNKVVIEMAKTDALKCNMQISTLLDLRLFEFHQSCGMGGVRDLLMQETLCVTVFI